MRSSLFSLCLASIMGLGALFIPASLAAEPERIPGTRVSIEVPDGFIPATGFQGFMHPDRGASITVSEVPQPFDMYRQNFSREAIEDRGMSVREHGRLTVDSFDGILVRGIDATGETAYEAWLLVFGDLRRSVMIIASYPERQAAGFRVEARDALLSVQWEPAMDLDPMEGLDFEIEASRRLRISGKFPDTLILTEEGRGRTSVDAPFLVVSSRPGRFDFGNLEEFSRQQLDQIDIIEQPTVVEGKLKSVAGMAGYEITAEATESRSGTPLGVYQLVLGEKGAVFIVQGFVGADRAPEFLPEFRAVAESLRPKR